MEEKAIVTVSTEEMTVGQRLEFAGKAAQDYLDGLEERIKKIEGASEPQRKILSALGFGRIITFLRAEELDSSWRVLGSALASLGKEETTNDEDPLRELYETIRLHWLFGPREIADKVAAFRENLDRHRLELMWEVIEAIVQSDPKYDQSGMFPKPDYLKTLSPWERKIVLANHRKHEVENALKKLDLAKNDKQRLFWQEWLQQRLDRFRVSAGEAIRDYGNEVLGRKLIKNVLGKHIDIGKSSLGTTTENVALKKSRH